MDYPFENLGPERFQMLCQALLVSEERNITCYPVGMPDGGRDALQRFTEEDEKAFLIYQVKFSRHPKKGKESRDWVIDAATGEIDKAKRLRARGAKRYIFISNVAGTSHLDDGSMDVLQAELEKLLEMPVQCWWRDDLSRRLDGNWTIKLRYPELLTGQDFLRLLLVQKSDESQNRRTNALRAFMADQYKEDQEVKFKQVELQNKLLDLFVDLPFSVSIATGSLFRNEEGFAIDPCLRISERNKGFVLTAGNDHQDVGTASLLLHQKVGNLLEQVVVEGAPGQGKSTLAQYLCQVHRIRLLSKANDLQLLPELHRTAPVYIPFKVDLRDLSEWLSGTDPFAANNQTKEASERTTEAFLARLVAHKAGGIAFDVHDLIEISKLSPLFIAFDGLDEVADIKRRTEVVNGVTKALHRLRENCPGLKVIITSRPAAFANSPGFEQNSFPHLQLGSVTRTQINSYAKKWLTARSLAPKERHEFEQILNEKLDQPHLRDLSKNPMQLTILLSLILTKGSALPDKRTSLYDAYIELFFGRESSKNPVVRDNLDLLKDIHRYLAWVLHSRAEGGRGAGTDGRLTTEEMKVVLQHYLKKEGQRTEIVEEIFSAMLERVVMIVSRIEGTHEFEVQPLREYFAARYLYDTAPYSPTGEEKSGTKPDRFDAIARNPFWLNVARFFCGCFSKGELLDLADRIKNLLSDHELGETRRPTILAAMLLQDWVFSQSPRAIAEVTSSLISRSAIRKLLPSELGYRHEEPIRLPMSGGGSEIVNKAFEYILDKSIGIDMVSRLSRFVEANLAPDRIDQVWRAKEPAEAQEFEHWTRVGSALGSLSRLSPEEVISLVQDRVLGEVEIDLFLRSGHGAPLANSKSNAAACIEKILGSPSFWPQIGHQGPFYLLPLFQRIAGHTGIYGNRIIFKQSVFEACQSFSSEFDSEAASGIADFSKKCYDISKLVSDKIKSESAEVEDASMLELIANCCDQEFADAPLSLVMGFAVCNYYAIRGRARKADLYDRTLPLIDRLRYAKSRANRVDQWWLLLQSAATNSDRVLALAATFNWAPTAYLLENSNEISMVLEGMPDSDWRALVTIHSAPSNRRRIVGKPVLVTPFKTKSLRFAFLFAQCESQKYGRAIFISHFLKSQNTNVHPHVAYFRGHHAVQAAEDGQIDWTACINILKSMNHGAYHSFEPIERMPNSIVEKILRSPEAYPVALWDQAQALFSARVAAPTAVAVTARKEKWFVD